MTIGIGGSNAAEQLDYLRTFKFNYSPIPLNEFQRRISQAQQLMQQQGVDAMLVNAGTNLYYFTGTRWYPSERLVAAVIPASGNLFYIAPNFEINTLKQYATIAADIVGWHEHHNPYQVLLDTLSSLGLSKPIIAIDESAPYFIASGLTAASDQIRLTNASTITASCRMCKSANEIALMQTAKSMTLEVHKAAAKILHPGISTQAVSQFIHQAHQAVGAAKGSYFCIVLFGEDSAYPHGVKNPKNLDNNDVVLIDTGCQIEGYNSDITRTYVFGDANERQRQVWQDEKQAQQIAFDAAVLGAPCGSVDDAARNYLVAQGYGPEYALPGLPHRTGHGIGLDIHEWPYLVRSDQTPLAPGMCFSNEPMLCIPGEFGIRLEDHFYMTEQGAKWFTMPSHSIDDPFGYHQ